MLKAMIAKFVNSRQDNWNVYLPAFLYTYRTSPHKSTGHTPYQAMMGRAPASEDGCDRPFSFFTHSHSLLFFFLFG